MPCKEEEEGCSCHKCGMWSRQQNHLSCSQAAGHNMGLWMGSLLAGSGWTVLFAYGDIKRHPPEELTGISEGDCVAKSGD